MSQNMGIVPHPEIHIFVSIHIPDFGTLCFFDKERVGGKIVDVMRNPSRHDLFGSFEKVF